MNLLLYILDSFCLWIKTKNLVQDLQKISHIMDFSNYAKKTSVTQQLKKMLFHLNDETEGDNEYFAS